MECATPRDSMEDRMKRIGLNSSRALILALVAGCTGPHDPVAGTYLLSVRLTSHLHPTQCVNPTDTYCFATDSISEIVAGESGK